MMPLMSRQLLLLAALALVLVAFAAPKIVRDGVLGWVVLP